MEEFSMEKFHRSLAKSHATEEEIIKVEKELANLVYPGISTREIYKLASKMLKRQTPGHSARFSLKRAIMQLGPSGYPFEKFIGALFAAKGYKTEVSQILTGRCVSHEVDVVAKLNQELVLVECKYHNFPGMNVDVKVPLYIHSRFQDLLDNGILEPAFNQFSGWIATNSRFSNDAMAFGNCKGLKLLGWNYPENEGLKDEIDRYRLYPLTCLSFLSRQEKNYFLDQGLVLVKELVENQHWIKNSIIPKNRISGLMKEIEDLNQG